MKKTKMTGKIWTGITSTAMCGALAVTMLISQRTQAAICSANIADGIFGPQETVAHVGDTVHYDITITESAAMCKLKQGTNFLVTPDGVSHRVADNYTRNACGSGLTIYSPQDPFTGTADGNFVNPSAVPTALYDAGLGAGPTTVFTYVVQQADIGRSLVFTSPQGNALNPTATGASGSPDGSHSVWFAVIMDGIVVDCTTGNQTNNPSGQGPAHVRIVTPSVSITKECDNAFTPYGQPINFHGVVCNTSSGGDPLQNISVTNTPAGGSPVQIVNFDSNVTTNGTPGRLYDGTLNEGECIGYHGSETPVNACGPQTNTVTVGATEVSPEDTFVPVTVYSSNSAVCFVSTAPCINVTKTCPQSIVYGTTTYIVGGVVTNCGNVPLLNVQVVDDNGTPGNPSDDITINIGSLDIGGSAPYTATNTVPVGCGPFTDTVVASGAGACGGLVTSTNNCTTTVTTAPCINVTKTCPESIAFGTTTYVVGGVVTNCGNVPLVNVSVVDDNGTPGNLSDDVTIFIGGIAVGGSAPYSATNTVPANCGPFTDTVVASAAGTCGGLVTATNQCTTSVSGSPCINVSKTCPQSIPFGQTTYVVGGVVTNCGTVPLVNVQVVDDNGTPGNLLDDVTITIADIPVGGSAPYTATNTVPANCGPFTDTVVASAAGTCGGLVTATNQCTTSVSGSPCIKVSKTCPASIAFGTTTYVVGGVVTNCGTVPLVNVQVVDDNGTPDNLLDDVTITIGDIPVGGSAPYTATNAVPASCGPFTDTVIASAAGACDGLVTATNQCTTSVSGSPCINVSKTCPQSIPFGQTTYVVGGVVTNCGTVPLVNVQVVDDNGTPGNLLDDVTITIADIPVGGSAPYTATNTVPANCGPFTDTVVASAAGTCGGLVTATNQCTTSVSGSPCIKVSKTCPASIAFGTTTYVVGGVVTNCGNVPLVNVSVVDDNGTPGNLSDDVTIFIGGIAVGGSAPYSATNTVPASCGPFTDTVIASAAGACDGLVTATNQCTTTVTTAPCIKVTKTCPAGPLDIGTTSYPVSGVVSNCGNVDLVNVQVVDDNGTPGNTGDDHTISIGALAPHTSSPWQATESVPQGVCVITNTVTASGQNTCSEGSVNSSASCVTTITCGSPKICVAKGVVCKPQVGTCDSSLNYGPTAVGMDGTNNSAFCYQVIAWNCGTETLTNVNLVDNLLGALSGFPTVLVPGQFATNYYSQSYGLKNGGASTNVNTVIATGTGVTSGIITNAQSSATAIVLPVKVSCSITLFSSYDQDNNTNDNKVTLPNNGTNTPVQISLNICNNGKVDLDVHISGLPSLVDCDDDVTPFTVQNPLFVPAGQCTTVEGCVIVPCGTSNITVTVQGTAHVGESGLCAYDSLGNLINTAPSSCPAVISCAPPVSCRVTGGGTLQPGNVDHDCVDVPTLLFTSLDNNAVDHISHGGQLGAPFSHQDCGEILGNPCIRGEWEHNRHYKDGTSDAISTKFHSANPKGVYDTLMCACLGCCGPTVDQPNGKFLGIGKKFTLCNPDDHRVCGPMPRPAPANAIIFTGIGVFGHAHGKGKGPIQGTTYAVFRVYIEDRSEGGGNHPKGANEPADVYCFQAWDTGVDVGKKTDYSTVAVTFRKALAADSCAFISSISTPSQIVNGVPVGGVPPGTLPSTTVMGIPADVADQGPIWGGNQQIHPSTGATCSN